MLGNCKYPTPASLDARDLGASCGSSSESRVRRSGTGVKLGNHALCRGMPSVELLMSGCLPCVVVVTVCVHLCCSVGVGRVCGWR